MKIRDGCFHRSLSNTRKDAADRSQGCTINLSLLLAQHAMRSSSDGCSSMYWRTGIIYVRSYKILLSAQEAINGTFRWPDVLYVMAFRNPASSGSSENCFSHFTTKIDELAQLCPCTLSGSVLTPVGGVLTPVSSVLIAVLCPSFLPQFQCQEHCGLFQGEDRVATYHRDRFPLYFQCGRSYDFRTVIFCLKEFSTFSI